MTYSKNLRPSVKTTQRTSLPLDKYQPANSVDSGIPLQKRLLFSPIRTGTSLTPDSITLSLGLCIGSCWSQSSGMDMTLFGSSNNSIATAIAVAFSCVKTRKQGDLVLSVTYERQSQGQPFSFSPRRSTPGMEESPRECSVLGSYSSTLLKHNVAHPWQER